MDKPSIVKALLFVIAMSVFITALALVPLKVLAIICFVFIVQAPLLVAVAIRLNKRNAKRVVCGVITTRLIEVK